MIRAITRITLLILCTGCATQGSNTFNYVPNDPITIRNEKTVTKPQAAVWDELVRELSKSFFVINNIERESRIINVSFNSNSPGEFVDCGRTTRSYTQGEKVERYDYEVAGFSTFKVAAIRQEHPAFANYSLIRREPSLEGRSNIYVAPDPSDSSRTVISVNTRYILTIRIRGDNFAEHASGNKQARGSLSEVTRSYIFNTNKPSREQSGEITIVCFGRGKLETDILNMVR